MVLKQEFQTYLASARMYLHLVQTLLDCIQTWWWMLNLAQREELGEIMDGSMTGSCWAKYTLGNVAKFIRSC